jgi:hypothetical protein
MNGNYFRVAAMIATIVFLCRGSVADQTSLPRTVTCEGPFASNTNHAKLVSAFGAENVTFQELEGMEGDKFWATVVYPNDPQKRLEIDWKDVTRRRHLAVIAFSGNAKWVAGHNVKLGMTLARIEALNGRPFQILDFDTDGGGIVMDWKGGALTWVSGGCKMSVRFGPDSQAPPSAFQKLTGQDLFSNNPDIGALKLRVIEIFVTNPK